ncbi:MAG: hypothetical protein Q4G34_06985 [Micrococcus sp.]|nr:hypothetical protein [Micrococcus sp.]
MSDAAGIPARTARVSRPVRVIVITAVAVLMLVATFVAGRLYPAPHTVSDAEVSAPIAVWATVEERVLEDTGTFAGTVNPGQQQDVTVEVDTPAVVVSQSLVPGETVAPGDSAGTVSGVTAVFLEGPLALYRTLTEGDSGPDVATLQESLQRAGHTSAPDAAGTLGPGTARALRQLFTAAGDPLPASEPVTVTPSQFLPIRAGGATVVEAARVGEIIGEDNPLLTLQTTAPQIEIVVDAPRAATLTVDDEVTIAASTGTVSGTIAEIGDFRVGEQNQRSGHPVIIRFDADNDVAPPVGQSVTVTTNAGESEPVLAVPLTALRGEGTDRYVLVENTSTSGTTATASSERRVDVHIDRTGGGYAAVTGELTPGLRVKVS